MDTMGYNLTPDQLSLRDKARHLSDTYIRPRVEEIDKKGEFPWDIHHRFKEEGFFGIGIPKEYGGSERGALACALVLEEIARVCTNSVIICGQAILGTKMIVGAGNHEQKARYLPPVARGEMIAAVAMTEADAGSDSAALRTRAVRKGNEYIINGTKLWITNSDVCDLFTAFVKTDPEKGREGISAFIIERNTPGVSVGKHEDKMGSTAVHSCEVVFEDCVVPKDNLVGKEGEGFLIAGRLFGETRYITASRAIGLAQGVLDYTVKFIKENGIHSELINSKIAEMATKIEAGRHLLYKACSEVEKRSRDSRIRISMAKYFCSSVAVEVPITALDILGKYGYTSQYPIERMMCDAKVTQIAEGTSQIQCAIIGGALSKGEFYH